jgi:hypothetical protein
MARMPAWRHPGAGGAPVFKLCIGSSEPFAAVGDLDALDAAGRSLKTLGGHRRYPAAEIRPLAAELQVQPTT